jgi:hypothetical protein
LPWHADHVDLDDLDREQGLDRLATSTLLAPLATSKVNWLRIACSEVDFSVTSGRRTMP